MAVFADQIYLIYLIIFIHQRYIKHKQLQTDERVLRATVTNGIISIISILFGFTAIAFARGYNTHLPNNFQYLLLDRFALVYNVVACVGICANYVDFVYNKICCCCRTEKMRKSFTPIVELV